MVGFLLLALLNATRAQTPAKVTISGVVRDIQTRNPLPFANISLLFAKDSLPAAGTITDQEGRFVLANISAGNYLVQYSFTGYKMVAEPLLVGELNTFLDLGSIDLVQDAQSLQDVTVTARDNFQSTKMDKKTFSIAANVAQTGGSVLDALKNLPGITTQDGRVQIRGSDKVMVLIDGQQSALTGFGGQNSLENIPASAIDKIEIINNPSSRYDAAGNAGIINIIYKKQKDRGFNAKAGITVGAGALWIRKENFPGIRPQYRVTPKINPSLALSYRKNQLNLFLQADNLYTHSLNKNEFTDRYYDDGAHIRQQLKRNRNTNLFTSRAGIDWLPNKVNTLTLAAMISSEKIIDRGDEPFFDKDLTKRERLWQFLEDELKTTAMLSSSWQYRFRQPGRVLDAGVSYTFHREDEKYFFTNTMPTYVGLDSFALISDEHVADVHIDYTHPLKAGRFETGIKFRRRDIPVNMKFKPGLNSPLDTTADGKAEYREIIPAIFGNYIYESPHVAIEAGLRFEYVKVSYNVNPNHPVYTSDSYHYFEPFPSFRFTYKIDEQNRLSAFYNRRVDRPNEVDIRIFPKYDDAEIIKVGNPALRPQFTNSFELGYKSDWNGGFVFPSFYHKRIESTISRMGSTVPGSTLIYNVFQNAGNSYSTGLEINVSQEVSKFLSLNLSLNGYTNTIDSFTVVNKYPQTSVYTSAKQTINSGNIKLNSLFHLKSGWETQVSTVYQAPDLVPQGKVHSRFWIDAGAKKTIQKGKGEIIVNATDVAGTLRVKREVTGAGFKYHSIDYYETQVFRIGYNYKF